MPAKKAPMKKQQQPTSPTDDVKGLNTTFLCEVQAAVDSIKAHPIFKDVLKKTPNAQHSSGFMQVPLCCHTTCHDPCIDLCFLWFWIMMVWPWFGVIANITFHKLFCLVSSRLPSTKPSSLPP